MIAMLFPISHSEISPIYLAVSGFLIGNLRALLLVSINRLTRYG